MIFDFSRIPNTVTRKIGEPDMILSHQASVKWKPLDLSMGRKFYKDLDFFIFCQYT